MKIKEMLNKELSVKFTILGDDRVHQVKMRVPKYKDAQPLRVRFFTILGWVAKLKNEGENLGEQVEGASEKMDEWQALDRDVLKLCIDPSDVDDLTDDEWDQFIFVSGGTGNSEVLKAAYQLCGIRLGGTEADLADSEEAADVSFLSQGKQDKS